MTGDKKLSNWEKANVVCTILALIVAILSVGITAYYSSYAVNKATEQANQAYEVSQASLQLQNITDNYQTKIFSYANSPYFSYQLNQTEAQYLNWEAQRTYSESWLNFTVVLTAAHFGQVMIDNVTLFSPVYEPIKIIDDRTYSVSDGYYPWIQFKDPNTGCYIPFESAIVPPQYVKETGLNEFSFNLPIDARYSINIDGLKEHQNTLAPNGSNLSMQNFEKIVLEGHFYDFALEKATPFNVTAYTNVAFNIYS